MATITNPTFAIVLAGSNQATLTVSYSISITSVERFLADNGLSFRATIQIVGDDPGDATDLVLHSWSESLAFSPGQTSLSRTQQLTVSMSSLDEDPGTQRVNVWYLPGYGWLHRVVTDQDEIFARVIVEYGGLDMAPTHADSGIRSINAVP
jgi:hypothetical protein